MASVFKRIGRNGKKSSRWTIQYLDASGNKKQQSGFTDKQESQRLANKLEEAAKLRRDGLIDSVADELASQTKRPISQHLDEFLKTLQSKGRTEKHVKLTASRLNALLTEGGINTAFEISQERVEKAIGSLKKRNDLGPRTVNHYIQAMKEFAAWLVPKRLASNPLLDIELRNTQVDIRKKRRALTSEEMSRLVAAARASLKDVQCFSGEQRARIYLLSYLTGLRKNEIASLTVESFQLDQDTPTLTVEAKDSKHRKKDVIPLHSTLVTLLRKWLPEYASSQPLFPNLGTRKAFTMIRKDLEAAGIPFTTKDGDADFHAAGRHTYITELLRNGTSIVVARELARHSDVNMTMRYTHIGLKDQAKGVENLPVDPEWLKTTQESTQNVQQMCSTLQQKCSKSGVFSGQLESQTVSNGHKLTKNRDVTSSSDLSSCVTSSQRKAPSVTEGAKVEAAGIAPASRDPSVRASTCVSYYLVFVRQPPTGRVPLRLSSHFFSPEQQPAVNLWPARIGVSEHDSRAEVILRSFVVT